MSSSSPALRRMFAFGAVAATAALALSACAGGSSSTLANCTPAHTFDTITPGTLTVASYDYPPLTQVDGDNLTGVEGDLLNEIAKRECLTLTVVSSGGASASIPSVQAGRADIAAGSWNRTAAREEIVRLGAPIVLDASAVVSTSGLTVDRLPGKRVASVAGNLWNDSLQGWLGKDFTIYQDDEPIYGDLKAGRIDAIIASSASSALRLKDNPIDGATVNLTTPVAQVPEFAKAGQVNWPSSKSNESLGAALDADVQALHDDGTIVSVLEKYGLDPALAKTGDPYVL